MDENILNELNEWNYEPIYTPNIRSARTHTGCEGELRELRLFDANS